MRGRHVHGPRYRVATGRTMDVRMRRARRADDDVMWRATLQTVWDDIPADERARLNRDKWEAHFRKKIEPYMAGDRTERWIPGGIPVYGKSARITTPDPRSRATNHQRVK